MSNNPYADPTQPAPTPASAPPPPEKKKMSGCAIAAIGCGAALVILLIVAALFGWWVFSNARSLGGDAMQQALTEAVQQSSLPPDQKQQRLDEIQQMTEDYQQQRIGHEAYFEWAGATQAELTQRAIEENAPDSPTEPTEVDPGPDPSAEDSAAGDAAPQP